MKPEYAAIVYNSLKEAGINFVAYLPDDQIHDAQKMIVEDPSFITVSVANEGEGVWGVSGSGPSQTVEKELCMLRRAQHERKIINVFSTCPVRPEPVEG